MIWQIKVFFWKFLKQKFQETYSTERDIEISRRKKEMSQNVLSEGNVSLEYGDES